MALSEKIAGVKIDEFYTPITKFDPETRTFLSSGKLHEIDEGIYYITAGKIPQRTCQILEKTFGIKKTYVMGFSWQGEMFGSANILTKTKYDNEKLRYVETFLNVASVLLQRRKAEKELEDREKLLSLVTNNMLNLVGHVNQEGIFQYISPSVKSVLGYEVEDVLGKNVFDFIQKTHPDDVEKVMSTFIESNLSYTPGSVQHRFKCADGHYVWMESLGNPLFDEQKNYDGVVFSMTDISSIKSAEEKYKTSLKEKELVLRELHHRVKNNMQIISSLLNLQAKSLKDKRDIEIFKSSQSRVKSMAIIHEKLYDSPDFAHINLLDYIKSLLEELFAAYNSQENKIELKINVDNLVLDMETAIPLGLLINELVSNSLKYAFSDLESYENAEISIELKKEKSNYKLVVKDNGIGLPENFDLNKTKTLGMQLINNLTNQIDGDLELDRSIGTKFTIKFKEQGYKERI
ncbi:sensor histidine kinase [Methanobacterium alcaliphilum]|uniref:sensor histidine kinase n=1 Tax=Methanobacterium alcaliphilum TaxID=392018 RepID=UPI00200AE934|nr:histidine kinase dimerization/phosphoacceptor domain -containing protein [Methanobacterium alcaliphilum]MCK9152103.1 PAS domain S-box protein [Methanobacterium alcaliphilum]